VASVTSDFGEERDIPMSAKTARRMRTRTLQPPQPDLAVPSIGNAKTLRAMLIYSGLVVVAAASLSFFVVVEDRSVYTVPLINLVKSLIE
jgi:hypothetical protein